MVSLLSTQAQTRGTELQLRLREREKHNIYLHVRRTETNKNVTLFRALNSMSDNIVNGRNAP